MIYKRLVEKKHFYYDGFLLHPDSIFKTKFEYQIKLKDSIELISVGTPTQYLEVDVIITKMDAPTAYLFGSSFKNLTDRLKVNDKYWYLANNLASDIRNYLDVFDENIRPVISSIDYIGEIPTIADLRTLIDNP